MPKDIYRIEKPSRVVSISEEERHAMIFIVV